jgi:molybdopterin-guanine dinucleotide biosynthesis protein B
MKIIGLAGWSGAGKTTLIAKLLPALIAQGLRVSTIKHAHHAFDLDKPGKDSWVHRQSGASEVLIASGRRWALMHELRGDDEPDLLELLDKLSHADLVLVEGFKSEPYPKIEIHRAANGKPALFPDDRTIIGIATDAAVSTSLPIVHLDDVDGIATMVLQSGIEREAMQLLSPIRRVPRVSSH